MATFLQLPRQQRCALIPPAQRQSDNCRPNGCRGVDLDHRMQVRQTGQDYYEEQAVDP